MLKYIPKHIRFIFSTYLVGILFFTFFRLVLLLSVSKQASMLPDKFILFLKAFLFGLRFDTVISGYILAIPLLILTILAFLKIDKPWIYYVILFYIFVLYSLSFFICASDIPYFKYYFSRLSISVLSWSKNPGFMFKIVFEELGYLKYFILFIIISFVYAFALIRIAKNKLIYLPLCQKNIKNGYMPRCLLFSIFALFVVFIAIRGRIALKSPIRTGTAYFSIYPLPNQLGLNPVFTFINSWLESKKTENKSLHLMDDKLAMANAINYLKDPANNKYSEVDSLANSISRRVLPKGDPLNANVIVVIMESMSAEKMQHYGNKDGLTPTLDSLADNSYCFNNIYTAGIHTFNGVFSTLFSFPALLNQHPMNKAHMESYSGFSNTLKNYQSIYFTTHDDQFDNVGGFLSSNGFSSIVSEDDYPTDKVLSTLGVPDHFMFEFSIPKLNELYNNNKPFFAAYMTASDHGPYIIPDGINFKAKNKDSKKKIIEYADWSINRFLHQASQQKWFSNTIFVFVADHGALMDKQVYDMPLSYNHTPMIIYSPGILKEAKQFNNPGGQIDVFPTIMGLLNIPYVNNTMGIDLINDQRPYMYFSADDKIGCIDKEYFYVYRTNGIESLYKYNNSDQKNYLSQDKSQADKMKKYAFSMLQSSQWLILNNKTK